MSNTINTTTSKKSSTRPANYTKKEWEHQTYQVFFRVVEFAERKLSMNDFVNDDDVITLFKGCSVPCDEWHVFQLFHFMTKDAVKKGERNIKTLTSLRQFFNGKWEEVDALNVRYTAPAVPQSGKKTRNMTPAEKMKCVENTFSMLSKEEKEEMIEKLMNALAA